MIALVTTPFAGAFLSPESSDTWVLVAFILFIGILYFARVHELIGTALDDRAIKIRKQLEEARELREIAQGKLAEWQRKQADVQSLAAEIVENAKREAERAAEEAKRSIEATVAQRMRSAEEQIALAEADAIRAVRNEAVDAAVAATSELLRAKIDDADAAMLSDKAIADVSARLN